MKALILGGTSDMALATAKELIKNGWSISITARNQSQFQDLTSVLGEAIECLQFDAGTVIQQLPHFEKRANDFDAVFSFIGTLPDDTNTLSPVQVQNTIDVNLTSLIQVLDVFAQAFEKRGSGTIVGVSSVAGERGKAKNMVYAAAKAGFTAYLSGLRNKLSKKGVHVITILPGYVKTKMVSGLELPPSLTISAEKAGKLIYGAFKNKKNVRYLNWKWKYLMFVFKHIPESIYKGLKL